MPSNSRNGGNVLNQAIKSAYEAEFSPPAGSKNSGCCARFFGDLLLRYWPGSEGSGVAQPIALIALIAQAVASTRAELQNLQLPAGYLPAGVIDALFAEVFREVKPQPDPRSSCELLALPTVYQITNGARFWVNSTPLC